MKKIMIFYGDQTKPDVYDTSSEELEMKAFCEIFEYMDFNTEYAIYNVPSFPDDNLLEKRAWKLYQIAKDITQPKRMKAIQEFLKYRSSTNPNEKLEEHQVKQ
jgi:hypothetical protein